MTNAQILNFTTPVGRIVQGNLYEAQTKDMDGKPLVIKNGPDAGKPTQRYYFALAIPKMGEGHWAHTEWGKQIWQFGHTNVPQHAQRADFAWKITDGDSQQPNKSNRIPARQEGFAGHWVLRLSSSFAVKVFSVVGKAAGQQPDPFTEKDAIRCGYYVQVNLDVGANPDQRNPGVYLNPRLVALCGYGPEIYQGPDPNSVGFGGGALPAGATAAPAQGTFAPAVPQPITAPMGAPPPGAVPAVPGALGGNAPAPAPAPVPVQPHTAILAAGAPPPPTAAPAAPPAHQMTAKAGAVTYEQYRTAGWSDQQLIQNGLMLA